MKNIKAIENILNHKNEIIERWDELGLLDEIEDEKKKFELAVKLENMTRLVLTEYNKNPKNQEEILAGILLPIVRRLYKAGIVIDNKILYDYVYENYQKYWDDAGEHHTDLDREMEAMCNLCDDLIKNNDIKEIL